MAAGSYFVATRITNGFAMISGSISVYATSRISGLFHADAKDDLDARSQWTHAVTGAKVTVFAHPQSLLHGQDEFHRDYSTEMTKQVVRTLTDDEKIPAPFHGFRYVGEMKTKNGEPVALVSYFLYDQDGHDIHQISLAVPREDAEAGEAVVVDFLRHTSFIDAVAPQR